MIWYGCYWGHDVRTLGSAEEEVIGCCAGHFTWEGVRCDTIKKGTTDNVVAYATNMTMPEAIMDNLESIQGGIMYKFISYSRIIVLYHTILKVTKKLLDRSDGILQAVA